MPLKYIFMENRAVNRLTDRSGRDAGESISSHYAYRASEKLEENRTENRSLYSQDMLKIY